MKDIHGHTILTKLKVTSDAWDQQFAWVQGYILALEDVISDLQESGTGDIMDLLDQVTKTLTQARATLAAMKQMEEEPASWKQFSGGLEPENQPTKE